jgi:formate-dependent nitrite reductase membrane component NrfD
MLLAEMVWHFWLAVPLALGAIAAVLTMLGLYAARVTKTRYPNTDS